MSARLTLAGADAYSDEWTTFAEEEFEEVKTELDDDPVFIKRKDVPELLKNRLFLSAWREWIRFRDFGLAHGNGPNGERPVYIKALQILQQEFAGFQRDEMRKNNG